MDILIYYWHVFFFSLSLSVWRIWFMPYRYGSRPRCVLWQWIYAAVQIQNGLSAKGVCFPPQCVYMRVCVTSPVKKNLMQKSRLCAQGVRLACHYTSKTPLGGPKKQLVCVISKKSCHHNLLVTELLTNECCRWTLTC